MVPGLPPWVLSDYSFSMYVVAFRLVFGIEFTIVDHIAGQEKPVPRLFPINSLQHFTVVVGISVVCGREWLKNPY